MTPRQSQPVKETEKSLIDDFQSVCKMQIHQHSCVTNSQPEVEFQMRKKSKENENIGYVEVDGDGKISLRQNIWDRISSRAKSWFNCRKEKNHLRVTNGGVKPLAFGKVESWSNGQSGSNAQLSVDDDGNLVIPVQFTRQLGLSPHDMAEWQIQKQSLLIRKTKHEPLAANAVESWSEK